MARLQLLRADKRPTSWPFKWKFTTGDLTDLLERLEQREQAIRDQHQAA